eukprot:4733670-Prymnesium_polylepis.1
MQITLADLPAASADAGAAKQLLGCLTLIAGLHHDLIAQVWPRARACAPLATSPLPGHCWLQLIAAPLPPSDCRQDLPEYFEDHIKEWMGGLVELLKYSNQQLVTLDSPLINLD